MAASDIRIAQKKLDRIYLACGGDVKDTSNALAGMSSMDETRTANMTPYQRKEYEVAVAMKNFRQLMEQESELKEKSRKPGDNRLHRVRNELRKREVQLKRLESELTSEAAKSNNPEERTRTREAVRLLQQTKKRYLESKRDVNATDDIYTGDEDNYGTTRSSGLDRPLINPVDDLDDISAPRANLRDDPEFEQFFMRVSQNDQLIDQALDRVLVGTTALHQQALNIHQELKVQEQLLGEAEEKVDNTTSQLVTLNKRVKKTIKKVNNDRLCMYLVCFVLLLALVGFILIQTKTIK